MSERKVKYCLYREGKYIVSQCLNIEVASFGTTKQEAVKNLREAVELYYKDEEAGDFSKVGEVEVGEMVVMA